MCGARTFSLSLAWIVALGALSAGCYSFDKHQTKDGQSHWLDSCSSRSDCGEDQICACGVCTIACEDSDRCGASAACEPVADRDACEGAPSGAENVCLAQCTSSTSCENAELACVEQACVARASVERPDGAAPPIATDGFDNSCERAGAFEPLVPRDGETCYQFRAHSGTNESEPLLVQGGESITDIYYAVPWPAGTVATRYGFQLDQADLLHRALLYEATGGRVGQVNPLSPGSFLFEEAKLILGWATGSCNVELPADVGLNLIDPESDKLLAIQWHHLNLSDENLLDASFFEICTVPREERANIASATLLGTEDIGGEDGMPVGEETTLTGECLNRSTGDVTIVAYWPHMHQLGTHARVELVLPDDTSTSVLDRPYDHALNVHYIAPPRTVMQRGEKLRTSCTYFNDTMSSVMYGLSLYQEQCYQTVFAYPAGALDKPDTLSLTGASNICWGD
jgi:hypothetical protein